MTFAGPLHIFAGSELVSELVEAEGLGDSGDLDRDLDFDLDLD